MKLIQVCWNKNKLSHYDSPQQYVEERMSHTDTAMHWINTLMKMAAELDKMAANLDKYLPRKAILFEII